MNNIWKKILTICSVALIIVLIAALSINTSGNTDVFSGTVNYITKPFKAVTAALSGQIDKITGYITEFDELAAENAQLKEQIAELQKEYLEYVKNNEENERLRALLGLADNNPTFEFADAQIIAWTASSWNSSFTINAGSDAGIELNDCAIDEYGNVIGIITETTKNSAVVTTILDTTSNISARVLETGDKAIASGKFDLMHSGELALNYLPDGSEIVNGYMIVTSGTSGICPANLPIGTIKSMHSGTSGLDDFGVITPLADFNDLSAVFIITSY